MARREHRQVDDAWLNLLLLIGDNLETEIVTGTVVSVRKATQVDHTVYQPFACQNPSRQELNLDIG